MKIRVVSSKYEIFLLDSNETIVHLTFRPSSKDVYALMEACPGIQAVQVPKSYHTTLASSVRMLMNMQKIQLIEGDVWGHRKDINDYHDVPEQVLDRIAELKKAGVSLEDIKNDEFLKHRVNIDLVEYIVEQGN